MGLLISMLSYFVIFFINDSCKGKKDEKGMDPAALLSANDSYTALKATGGLIITGPTGTNVNDLTVALVDK